MKSSTSQRKTKSAKPRSFHPEAGLRPCDCESLTDICSLNTSHRRVGNYDIMLQHDQAVIIVEHPLGKKCRKQIVIPRHAFLQMIAWYETTQICGQSFESSSRRR